MGFVSGNDGSSSVACPALVSGVRPSLSGLTAGSSLVYPAFIFLLSFSVSVESDQLHVAESFSSFKRWWFSL
ncbi:hypothetical protein Bca4012_052534 [Brassica carinata]